MRRNSYQMQDHTAEAHLFARRAITALIAVAALMGVLIANLYYLQIEKYQTYQTRSNENRIKVQPVPPNRGIIRDINGNILAANEPSFSLEIIPEAVTDMEWTLSELQLIIDIPDEQVEQFKRIIKYQRRFKSIPIKTKLTENEVAAFSVKQHLFPGVAIEARLNRHYPYTDTMTHVIGYVGKINKRDLNRLEREERIKNYAATRSIGKLGLERFYEEQLHGTTGSEEVEVNHRSRVLRQLSIEAPKPGTDLHLAIAVEMQEQAKKSLRQNRGAIVAMDPRDGAILAMYSNPSYDPNLFVTGISQKDYSLILNSKDKPMLNRTTQGQYPPASTIKPQLALLGLHKKLVTPETTVWDPGYWRFPNVETQRNFRDWKVGGHGWVDLVTAIKQSCDIYFYDLAYRLGIDEISPFISKFGFGDYTGIDIHEEYKATMPSREWKKEKKRQPWYQGDTISIGIGQGYWTATPMQLAMATSVLVNKGDVIEPKVVSATSVDESISLTPIKKRNPVVVNNPKHWDTILDSMYQTVNAIDGTARAAFVDAVYTAAGKTGTAQLFSLGEDEEYDASKINERRRDNAMFVGYAPYDNPSIVIVVAVENAGGGSANAAPVAREMMDLYFSMGLANKRNISTEIINVEETELAEENNGG
ncbi:penicillin-binding protein 2 [Psychrosphaera haliotis]|uniref:Peptidoglycan D,D-transpeptidase MrdA n=1 Tax=Psychrosphaera haliotis TaxID=555083 RepID=A0A6N8FAG2_9GAMM|nr:penicillin-binding protein 2 [Psychrosphaera haliotis]MUH71960.1 penicillin-binding protein 2 [Psychrosphaera haliotis]